MKKLLMVLPMVFLLCFAFGCQKAEEVAEEPAVDIAAETEALKEAFWANQKAGTTKDIELMMSFVADDVVSSGIEGGKEGIREWYTNYFEQGRYWDNQSIQKIEVSSSGDMGYIVFSWDSHRVVEGEARVNRGSNTVVWKKQADGTWKIAAI